MSTVRVRDSLSTPYGIALLVVLLASFAYALITAQVVLAIAIVGSVTPTVVFLYLFYRLVLAVEQIAADS